MNFSSLFILNFVLIFSGASYADSLRFQRCIDLWFLAMQIRVNTYSILYSETCFTAQALVRLMLDLHDKCFDIEPTDYGDDTEVPRFEDVFAVFDLLSKNLIGNFRLFVRFSLSQTISCCFVFHFYFLQRHELCFE